MNICVEVKCPYCGTINKVLIEAESLYIPPIVATCDMLKGGCDEDFVIKPQLSISTKIFKIQEDEPDGK
jgi:hypothetical protein